MKEKIFIKLITDHVIYYCNKFYLSMIVYKSQRQNILVYLKQATRGKKVGKTFISYMDWMSLCSCGLNVLFFLVTSILSDFSWIGSVSYIPRSWYLFYVKRYATINISG